eukprot:492157_1
MGHKSHTFRKFVSSFDGVNLNFTFKPMMSVYVDLADIRNIKYYQNGSTIIYCPLQKDCDRIVKQLNATNVTTAVTYHAGLKIKQREINQNKWQSDEYQCIVATEAFGMGIDKPNVRYVIHYGSPNTVEGYYQQVGRAGRDGMISYCVLFYGSGDFTIKNDRSNKIHDKYKRYQTLRQTEALRKVIFGDKCRVQLILKHFNEFIPECFDRCDICTVKLESEIKVDVSEANCELKEPEIKTIEIDDVNDCKQELNVSTVDSLSVDINVFIAPVKTRQIANNIQEQIMFDSNCLLYSIDTPMPIQRHSFLREVVTNRFEITVQDKNRIVELLSGKLSYNKYGNAKEDIVLYSTHSEDITYHTIFRIHHITQRFQIIEQTLSDQNSLLSLPNLALDSSASFDITNENKQAPCIHQPSQFNQNTIIASESLNNIMDNNMYNEPEDLTVDVTRIRRQQLKYKMHKDPRNRIDHSIENFKLREPNVLWTKTVNGVAIKRYLEIEIIKTSSKVVGKWKEMENDTWHNINKTWIKNQKQQFCIERLIYFFKLSKKDCGKTRPETASIFCQKMTFLAKDHKLDDFVKEEVIKICKSLKSPCAIVSLLEKTVLDDDCLCEDNVFLDVLRELKYNYLFDNIATDIWNYMLFGMIKTKNMRQFNKKCYIKIFNNWNTQKRALTNWIGIKKKIEVLRTKYADKCQEINLDFDEFFPGFITIIKETIVEAMNMKCIDAIYAASSGEQIHTVKYTRWSCGGASIDRMYTYYGTYKHGVFVPGLDRLTTYEGDNRVPLRIIDEMQTQHNKFRIMHPDLDPITLTIICQIHSEASLLIRLRIEPNFDKLINNIVQRADLKQQFRTLYDDWPLEKLVNIKGSSCTNINVKNLKRMEVIDAYYQQYAYGIAEKYNWFIISSQEYKKEFIALRQQEKHKFMMKGKRTDPHGCK